MISLMKWYKVTIDGQERIVRVDNRIMRYAVIDYYDSRLWFTGSAARCKKWIEERRVNHGQ